MIGSAQVCACCIPRRTQPRVDPEPTERQGSPRHAENAVQSPLVSERLSANRMLGLVGSDCGEAGRERSSTTNAGALCSKWERIMPLLCWHRQCSIKDESTYRKPQMIGNGVVIGRITVDDVVCTACVQGLTHMRSPCAHETGGGSGLAGQHAPTVNTM